MTPTPDSKTSEAPAGVTAEAVLSIVLRLRNEARKDLTQARVNLWLKVLNELADGRKAGVITPVEQARIYDAIYPMIDTPTLERLIAAMENRQA